MRLPRRISSMDDGHICDGNRGHYAQDCQLQTRTKNPVWETMTKWDDKRYFIRVWRTGQQYEFGPDDEIIKLLTNTYYDFDRDKWFTQWQSTAAVYIINISKLVGIAAIEVLDKDGNGIVYYPDWN